MRWPLVILVVACRTPDVVPDVRFANAPAVEAVNDRQDVPKPPKERAYMRIVANFDAIFRDPLNRVFELEQAHRARGVNALDEVPDSTWFTNRIGVREVTAEEIRERPGAIGSPEAHKPWTILSSKVGGQTLGFIMQDTRGERFLLKFDARGFPEGETATHLIVGRLLWAFGYNVTDDYIVYLREGDLVLAPDAVIVDPSGERRLDREELENRLALVNVGADGSMRALASHWLPGKRLGPHGPTGIREDDPNDRIPHELRRELRGAYVPFAWLDHNDIQPGNMLDVWLEDSELPGRHYVKHYWLDFGVALGFASFRNRRLRYSYEFGADIEATMGALLTLGLFERPWEDRAETPPAGVGLGFYELERYDPGSWKPQTQQYIPILVADRIDKFWGAKILMKFRPEHIEAAVAAGQLSDPRAVRWLTEALIARQRMTAAYWFERVNPLDEFRVTTNRLCFDDLAIVYAFRPPAGTHYALTFFDRNEQRVATTTTEPSTRGVACAPLHLSNGAEGYTIVRIVTTRPGFVGATYVHVARDRRTGAPRVIGIWRV